MLRASLLITRKTLWKRKTKSIAIFLVYTVILATVISIFSAKIGARDAYREYLQTVYGTYSGIVFEAEPVSVPDESVQSFGFFRIQGSFRTDHYFSDIYIGAADETAYALHSIRASEGRLPAADSEIAVEKWLAEKLGAKAGEPVTINGENYMVTGIINNYSELQGSLLRDGISETLLPAVLVSEVENPIAYHCTLLLKEESEEALAEIANFLNSSLYRRNENMEQLDTQPSYRLYQSTVNSIFCILMIAAAGILLLLCYLVDIEFKKTVEIAGALGSGRMLKLTVPFFYSFFIYLPSLVPALFLSYAISDLYRLIIEKKGIAYFRIQITAGSAAFSAVICFVMILAAAVLVRIIRTLLASARRAPHSRATINTSSAFLLYSYKNLLMNLKRFYAVSIMLVLCIVVIQVGKIIQKESSFEDPGDCDYEITRFASMAEGIFEIPVFQENMPSVNDFKPILENHNVQRAVYINGAEVKLLVSADSDSAEKTLMDSIYGDSRLRSSDGSVQKQIKEEMEKYGYQENDILYFSRVLGAEEEILQQLTAFQTVGQYDPQKLLQGSSVIMCVPEHEYQDVYKELIGKQLTLSHIRYNDFEGGNLGRNRIDYSVTLDAIILIPEEDPVLQEALGSYYSFVTANKALERMDMDFYFRSCFLQLYDQYAVGTLEEQISQLTKTYPNMIRAASFIETNTAQYITGLLIDTTVHCLIGLLVLLASFILLIHYVINADSKRGLIRRLYAIGLSKKELNWILLTEYLNYILFALILSVPIMGMLATMAVTINSDRDGIGFTAADLGRDYILLIAACALIAILIYFANKRWISKILSEPSAF